MTLNDERFPRDISIEVIGTARDDKSPNRLNEFFRTPSRTRNAIYLLGSLAAAALLTSRLFGQEAGTASRTTSTVDSRDVGSFVTKVADSLISTDATSGLPNVQTIISVDGSATEFYYSGRINGVPGHDSSTYEVKIDSNDEPQVDRQSGITYLSITEVGGTKDSNPFATNVFSRQPDGSWMITEQPKSQTDLASMIVGDTPSSYSTAETLTNKVIATFETETSILVEQITGNRPFWTNRDEAEPPFLDPPKKLLFTN